MKLAPTYIASIVGVIIGLQSMLGLDFAPEQWTAFILVLLGLFNAARQVITGRSTLGGKRPENFVQ